jgi:RNA polymerase sigma factor (sigma-70 family)
MWGIISSSLRGNMIPNIERLEDDFFAAWSQAEGEEKERLLPLLVGELRSHARKVIWTRLQKDLPDITQVAVWQAIKGASKFRGDAKFSTWFHQIVINLCNDYLREKQRTPTDPFEEWNEEGLDLEDGVIAKLDLERVRKSLDGGEQVLLNWLLEGYTGREIADRESISFMAVARQIQDLRKKVRRGLHGRV